MQTTHRSPVRCHGHRSARSRGLLLFVGFAAGAAIGPILGTRASHADVPSPREAPLRTPNAAERALGFTATIEGDGVYGAGVLVAPRAGLVHTAEHVIAEMKHPRVSFADGKTFDGKVLEKDRALDLAVVQIPAQPDRPAPVLGDSLELHPGDPVLAVGCPRHLPFTVSRGIVSYVGRWMDGARWLQTDIPINDGNSGGPVVDSDGRLVGMTSFILRRAQGLSFALPIPYAIERFPSLQAAAHAYDLTAFRRWRGPLPGANGG